MSYAQYLIKSRHSTRFYARVSIPIHLRSRFGGKRDLRRSTHTCDLRLAKSRARQFWVRCHELFEKVEASSMSKDKVFTSDLIATLLGPVDFGGDRCEVAAEKERQEARRIETMAKEQPELMMAALKSRQLTNSTSVQPSVTDETSFRELADEYIEAQRKKLTLKEEKYKVSTFNDALPRMKFWRHYFGNCLVRDIKQSEIIEAADWLYNLPSSFTKKGISIDEAIQIAKGGCIDFEKIGAATYNHYARELRGMLDLAYKKELHTKKLSEFVGSRNTKLGQSTKRLSFTAEDFKKMYPGEDYGQGMNAGRKMAKTPLPARFWLPLIGAFSGARVEEIAQITPREIIRDEKTGIVYLNITDSELAGDGKLQTTKNANSIRPVPIHPMLDKIGFLDFVAERRLVAEDQSLFSIERGEDDKMASAFSKWFTTKPTLNDIRQGRKVMGYIERCGVESKGVLASGIKTTKCFHSFRHTVVDNLRRNKKLPSGVVIRDALIALIVGHTGEVERSVETANYGEGDLYLELRRDVINQISYPGVDFESISWERFKQENGGL